MQIASKDKKSALLVGTAGQDVRINNTQSGKMVATVGLQIAAYGDEAKWINVEGWNSVAEVMRWIKKGDMVMAIGDVKTHDFTGRDGTAKSEKRLNAQIVYYNGLMLPPNQAGDGPDVKEPVLEDDDGELPF